MRRALSTVMIIIMLLAGVGFFVYPDVASWWNGRSQRGMVMEYDEEVANMMQDHRAAMMQRAREYNMARPEISISDPFADAADLPYTYSETLNVGGVMARIEIPAINVNLPIFHGTSSSVLDRAAGHLHGTHLPIGGYGNHSVITAHSGLSNSRMFTDLLSDQVGPGTLFFITVLGERLAYEVDYIRTVLPHEVDSLRVYPGRDLVTLITCTPLTVNSHRLLVRGTRIPYSPELIADIVPYITVFTTNWRIIVTLGIFLAFILIFSIYQIIRILRGRHSKMLEKKIEELERKLERQRRPSPALAAGPDLDFNDPYITIPSTINLNPAIPKKHVNPDVYLRSKAKAQAKRRKSHRSHLRTVSIVMTIVLFIAGPSVILFPRVYQQISARQQEATIVAWRESLDDSRSFIINRWEEERDALWDAIADLPIASNGSVYVADTGHIFIGHADIAFGASGTPAINSSGYLTLGGVPVGTNGYITVANLSVSHNGSLNISSNGSASFDNITVGICGGLHIGNYPLNNLTMQDLDNSHFDMNFLFNFDPVNDDPMYWLHSEMVDYNHELFISGQAGLISLEATEDVDFSVVENAGFPDEMLAYLTMPTIDTSLPIFAGSSHGNMLRGAAHLTQSSLPVGGINTNSVITAHRGLSRARMFRDIPQLQIGDEIIITNFYQTLVYRVICPLEIIDPTTVHSVNEHNFVISPYNIASVRIVPGRDLITLFTCEPYRINTHRLLVIAERCLDS